MQVNQLSLADQEAVSAWIGASGSFLRSGPIPGSLTGSGMRNALSAANVHLDEKQLGLLRRVRANPIALSEWKERRHIGAVRGSSRRATWGAEADRRGSALPE
jgi:hypothetical protein